MSAYRVVDLEEECGGGERQDPEQDLEHEVEAEHEVEDLQALVLAVPQGEVHCHHHLMETQICHTVNRLRSFLSPSQSIGYLVTWSLGHLVTRSLGHLVISVLNSTC